MLIIEIGQILYKIFFDLFCCLWNLLFIMFKFLTVKISCVQDNKILSILMQIKKTKGKIFCRKFSNKSPLRFSCNLNETMIKMVPPFLFSLKNWSIRMWNIYKTLRAWVTKNESFYENKLLLMINVQYNFNLINFFLRSR